MLWRSSELIGTGIQATDGPIGGITDLLFEDDAWKLRWVVVDTGIWLPGREVLLPPDLLGRPEPRLGGFPVALTRRQVEESPGAGSDAPVSRQVETGIYGHYGWTPYWEFGASAAGLPEPTLPLAARLAPLEAPTPAGDPHLRSAKEVSGYHLHASDGDIGHVEELLVEDESWAVRYVVVATRNFWPGRKVLLAPRWFRRIDWGERAVTVALTREQVKASPAYDPAAAPGRLYEERLHAHYGVPPYWG